MTKTIEAWAVLFKLGGVIIRLDEQLAHDDFNMSQGTRDPATHIVLLSGDYE